MLYSDIDPTDDIAETKASVFVHGPEFGECEEHVRGLNYCSNRGIATEMVDRIPGISTTSISSAATTRKTVSDTYWSSLETYPAYPHRADRLRLDVEWVAARLGNYSSLCDLGAGDGEFIRAMQATHKRKARYHAVEGSGNLSELIRRGSAEGALC